MTAAPAFLKQGDNLLIVMDGKSHTVSKNTHICYDKIVDALKSQDWDVLQDLLEPKQAIINFSNGNLTIEDNEFFWNGEPFHNALSARMLEMFKEGYPIDSMVNFMENLMENPSKRSVTQLYGFLEKNSLPITEDGYFLAYKKVSSEYMDLHTGKIDNSIGSVVTMERNTVDDDPDRTCSSGLHFCSESYLGSFGNSSNPIMILKIDPADVVSIPSDYNGAKGRCCRYEVVGQISGDPKAAFTSSVNKEHSAKLDLQSKWPFAISSVSDIKVFDEDDFGNILPEEFELDDEEQLYDLVRQYGGYVEHTGLTLDEARARVYKNLTQKKAVLRIVKAGTDDLVN